MGFLQPIESSIKLCLLIQVVNTLSFTCTYGYGTQNEIPSLEEVKLCYYELFTDIAKNQ